MADPFWTDNSIEPKRQNRWVVQFEGLDPGNLYFATKVTRPAVEISTKEYKFLNHTFNYPGRVTWNKVTLTIVDPGGGGLSGNNAMNALITILKSSGYVIPGTDAGAALGTISKSNAVGAVANAVTATGGTGTATGSKSILIKMIGAAGDGTIVEQWELMNSFISKITPSELSYEDDGMATVDIEITYDYCKFSNDGRATVLGETTG